MALKGTDIVKKLPEGGKKNCKECGYPTCFAFAMKLATSGVAIAKCNYLSADVRAELEDALAPPIKLVTIGSGTDTLKIGNEEVLYRHEKTFVHAPGIALLISDTETEAAIDAKVRKITEMQFPWVGRTLKADLLALQNKSADKGKFEALVKKISTTATCPLMLMSDNPDTLLATYKMCIDKKPLLYAITKDTIDTIIAGIKDAPVPVVVKAENLEGLIPLTTKLKDAGIEEIVLDPVSRTMQDMIKNPTPQFTLLYDK